MRNHIDVAGLTKPCLIGLDEKGAIGARKPFAENPVRLARGLKLQERRTDELLQSSLFFGRPILCGVVSQSECRHVACFATKANHCRDAVVCITETGGSASAHSLDLCGQASIGSFVSAIETTHGAVRVLINNTELNCLLRA